MKQIVVSIALLLSWIFVFEACNKASVLGYDLFAGDLIGTELTDTMTVIAWTEIADSVRTYSPSFDALNTFLFGHYRDAVVGDAESVIYAQLRLNGAAPDLEGMTFDSAVLVLPYDTTAFYGNTEQYFTMRVAALEQPLETDSSYYDQAVFSTGESIALHQFWPRPDQEVWVIRPGEDINTQDTLIYNTQLHIPIHTVWAEALFAQASSVLESDSSLLDYLPGVELASYLPTDGMLAFDLDREDAGLVFYYHNDTLYHSYKLRFGGVRMTSFRHDYAGSLVESYLNDSIKGQELLFLQGMRGLRIHVRIPYAGLMRDSLINRAELELSVVPVQEDGGMAPPPVQQIILSKRNEEGDLVVIDDVVFALERNQLTSFFGGDPRGMDPITYTLNLTSHFMDLRRGETPDDLYITVLYRNTTPARTVFGGTQHPNYPMKLKVYYTPLDQ